MPVHVLGQEGFDKSAPEAMTLGGEEQQRRGPLPKGLSEPVIKLRGQ